VKKSVEVKEDAFTLVLNATGGLHPLMADINVPPPGRVDEGAMSVTMVFEGGDDDLSHRVDWPIHVDGVEMVASSYGGESQASINFAATAGKYQDAVTQPLRLLQPGFPILNDRSGLFTPLETGVKWCVLLAS